MPFAIAACTGSDNLKGSTILSEAAFVVSREVRKIILAGIAPVITVPNPLYRPGMPSTFRMFLKVEKALCCAISFEAT